MLNCPQQGFLSALQHPAPQLRSLEKSQLTREQRCTDHTRKRRRVDGNVEDKWQERATTTRRVRRKAKESIVEELEELETLAGSRDLTHNESRELKRLRRKQKNREAAQNSRNRKKMYVETLEQKVETLASENHDLKNSLHELASRKSQSKKLEEQNSELNELVQRLQEENRTLKSKKTEQSGATISATTRTRGPLPSSRSYSDAYSNRHPYNSRCAEHIQSFEDIIHKDQRRTENVMHFWRVSSRRC